MADEGQTIRGINWRETFPFTHLFRGFRVAIHPSKLVLGLVALLALYMGGRLLDAMWAPRSLAVPDEIGVYQRIVETGGTSDQFIADRVRSRDTIEDAYAQRLLKEGIVSDRAPADRAAARGEKLGDLTRKIIDRRNAARDEARRVHDAAWGQTNSITDKNEQSKRRDDIDAAYRAAVRAAYEEAASDWRGQQIIRGMGLFHALFAYEARQVDSVIKGVANWNWLGTSKDARGPGVIDSVINFFRIAPIWLMRYHPLYFIIFTLWFLTIWAIFGGAIARIAAIHVARDEKLSVRAALAFSLGKFLSFVSAPLIPLVIVLLVGLVPLLAGLIGNIPGISIIMTALFVIVLAAGFVMTLVLLGTFGGFNLMYPTIAVEGSDSFDAISRSFSYVYARPWRMVFYTTIAIIYGALCYLFVRLFIWLMLSLTHYFVGATLFADAPSLAPLWPTMWPGPQHTGTLSYQVDWITLRWDQHLAAFFLSFWVYLVVGALGAFVISFYFSANTIIYYLMRNEVDATEMDDVYLEQTEEESPDTATPLPTAPASAVGAVIVETATVTPPGMPAAPPPAGDTTPPAPAPDKVEPPPT